MPRPPLSRGTRKSVLFWLSYQTVSISHHASLKTESWSRRRREDGEESRSQYAWNEPCWAHVKRNSRSHYPLAELKAGLRTVNKAETPVRIFCALRSLEATKHKQLCWFPLSQPKADKTSELEGWKRIKYTRILLLLFFGLERWFYKQWGKTPFSL